MATTAQRDKMKSDATIRRRLKELRAECIDGQADPVLMRIAYAMECAIRWAREDTVGWETPANEARLLAEMLHREIAR